MPYREIHVSAKGSNLATGDIHAPFRTISRAAQVARSGDRVIVHEGVYREWVRPPYGGVNAQSRISYEAASGERPIIKGW